MNTTLLASIEEATELLASTPPGDPRDTLRAARTQELAERGRQRRADQYLHEAVEEPDLAAEVARQYWAAPYDTDYLVVTFPPDAAFKELDVVALSSKEDLSFDDLKAAAEKEDQPFVLEMIQPLALRGKPWLTSIPVSEAKAGGGFYLHHFFVAKAAPGERGVVRRTARRKVLDASSDLAQIENPRNVDGVARSPHPAIPPHRTPLGQGAPAESAGAATLPAPVSAGAPMFQRLFLTLAGPALDGVRAPWRAYVVLNVELTPGQVPEKYDYIALADHYPNNARDYLTSQWQDVTDLDEGPSYETWTRCDKEVPGSSMIIADLDKLETMYIFYGRWYGARGDYGFVGNPVSFKKQKHWMEDSLGDIGQKKLHEIVIPGTHDAGTFDPEAKGTDIANNAQAQNLDFPGQLALGMRYFDCRLQNWPKTHPTQPFYFNHGGAWTWTEITDLTAALKEFFVTDQSKDIVILDFSRFDAFGPSDYTKFFNLFKNDPLFGPAMITPDEARDLTIGELFNQGKRLLILCDNATARQNFNLGESINIHAEWANTNDRNKLKVFLDVQVANHAGSGKLWALQAVLTPFYPWPISPRADEVSRVLRTWVVHEWWDEVNVVFCDFAAGADLVHAAMACNARRANPVASETLKEGVASR